MKAIEDKDPTPDASELLRRIDNKFVYREDRQLSKKDTNPFRPTPCLAPPSREILELEEGCPNFGGGNKVTPLEEREPTTFERDLTLVEPEPMPTTNELPFQWPAAIERIIQIAKERDEFGFKKYGTRLQPFNGRDPLKDAFQEGLDLLVYIEQELFERPYKEAIISAAVSVVNDETDNVKFQEHFATLSQAVQKLKEIQSGNGILAKD